MLSKNFYNVNLVSSKYGSVVLQVDLDNKKLSLLVQHADGSSSNYSASEFDKAYEEYENMR